MKNTFQLIGLGTAIVLASATVSVAQPMGGKMRPGFEQIDANGDGQIQREEMLQMQGRMFADADENGDGKISRDELVAKMQAQIEQRADRMISRYDTDKDGAISDAEMQEAHKGRGDRMARMFDRADSDGDGALSKAEFDAARAKMHDGKHHRHGKHHKNKAD